MADWSALRRELTSVADRATYSWSELDALVGGLPPSAYKYPAFWSGDRSMWRGFTATAVRVGVSVTFVRRSPSPQPAVRGTELRPATGDSPDVVLVSCVKRKLDNPAPAEDLYISALFKKQRAYAERAGGPWFVLSAQHGLVAPTTVLAPYDLRLSDTSADYRRQWGIRVVTQLAEAIGPLAEKIIEVHAGAAYVDPIRALLRTAGAAVLEPLHGLVMGSRLAWYNQHSAPTAPPDDDATITPTATESRAEQFVQQLVSTVDARTPAEVMSGRGAGLRSPGLYSWWVDAAGAAELEAGLGHPVAPGLIYAGLAGATRSRSGRKSQNTLWGRIATMHLGGGHELSTFRFSLGSILAHGGPTINEEALTQWMYAHLRVVTVPVENGDTLDELESEILRRLDPPLNLAKVDKSPLRARLTQLRKHYGHTSSR